MRGTGATRALATHEPHLLVVNKSHAREVVAKLTINQACESLVWFDPSRGDWLDVAAVADRFQTIIEFPLPPGGGRLLRLRRDRRLAKRVGQCEARPGLACAALD